MCVPTKITYIFKYLVASKEIGLEVNADKTKYMVMYRDQNAGRSHNMKDDNSLFEGVEQFEHLGTKIKNAKRNTEKFCRLEIPVIVMFTCAVRERTDMALCQKKKVGGIPDLCPLKDYI